MALMQCNCFCYLLIFFGLEFLFCQTFLILTSHKLFGGFYFHLCFFSFQSEPTWVEGHPHYWPMSLSLTNLSWKMIKKCVHFVFAFSLLVFTLALHKEITPFSWHYPLPICHSLKWSFWIWVQRPLTFHHHEQHFKFLHCYFNLCFALLGLERFFISS